ncbi:CheR family methyltransferase [Virgibacillus kekensis]|uniref:protein-glutamate O-methyltransferase n=1 Tax=Virgibacillus kekensis TaxID=202261 RepID=A0ABV9DHB5_9BACI
MSEEYLDFIAKVREKSGIDLSSYKEAQMKRRLTSLRDKRGFTSFRDYFLAINRDKLLFEEFMDRLTINVSGFYRNSKRWEVLKDEVIPHLLRSRTKLSIWSAACSSGEEPYSVALLMKEHFPTVDFQVMATDIDSTILQKAERGIYRGESLKELPENLKLKYFRMQNGLYYINETVKNHINYKRHNLLADRYPRNVDLIICRNVLIYFTDQAKNEIYHRFSESLRSDGVLFVGSTEQIFTPNNYNLSLVDTFFYRKTSL